jgi:hypothetical protein
MQRVSQPTLVVTRFEHMNLFHTITDWYSAYMTARVVNLKRRPRLLFVDGHCQVNRLLDKYEIPCFPLKLSCLRTFLSFVWTV